MYNNCYSLARVWAACGLLGYNLYLDGILQNDIS